MTRVFLADAQNDTRSALRLVLVNLQMQVVGEAGDWATALGQIPSINPDMLVLEWELTINALTVAALAHLHSICPNLRIVVISGLLEARHAALQAGAHAFISIGDAPDRVIERLCYAAEGANA